MKKRKQRRTLSRKKEQRIALMRTLSVSLIKHKRIETTLAKAKEMRPFAEQLATKAKKGLKKGSELAALRLLKKDLPVVAISELMKIAEKIKERKGGYLRIIKLPLRKSDSARMALVEWVDETIKSDKDDKDGKKKKSKKVEDKK
ncbi:MAG: 50S ribosomal protein L17 [Patescibacteria group bacterium]|nr:50S ribosomal protein L17 [Patescibacteria group bacterium]